MRASRTGLDPRLDEQLHRPLIDGRLIQMHLQFVAPWLTAESGPTPEVRQASPSTAESWEQLRQELAAVQLHYFLDLVGTDNASVARLLAHPAGLTAGELLRVAAGQLMRMWLTAEGRASRRLTDTDAAFIDSLCHCFASAVSEQARRRCSGMAADPTASEDMLSGSELLTLLDSVGGYLLSKELMCLWFPGWSNAQFIYNSPLDILDTLPSGLDEQAPLAVALRFERRQIELAGVAVGCTR